MESTTVQKLSAEAIGTFVLVLLGCGAAVASTGPGGPNIVSTGLTFGLVVLVMAFVFGRVSGGHFNPAVTVGAAAGGRFAWKDVPAYVAAQVGGAIVGAIVLFIILKCIPDFSAHDRMGQNGYGADSTSHIHWYGAFVLELVLTAIFVFVILGATDKRNPFQGVAPVAIGLTLAAIHFFAIPLDGTSVNPARSIGPALFAGGGHIVQLWLFILAPIAGAALAGAAYPAVVGHDAEPVLGSGLLTPSTSTATDVGDAAWTTPEAASQPAEVTQPIAQDPVEEGQTVPKQEWKPERIIQDGWEWDYEAQQWKPLEEPPA